MASRSISAKLTAGCGMARTGAESGVSPHRLLSDCLGQISQTNQRAFGNHYRTFDRARQLSHVAGPRMLHQRAHRGLIDADHAAPEPAVEFRAEVRNQKQNVASALAN